MWETGSSSSRVIKVIIIMLEKSFKMKMIKINKLSSGSGVDDMMMRCVGYVGHVEACN